MICKCHSRFTNDIQNMCKWNLKTLDQIQNGLGFYTFVTWTKLEYICIIVNKNNILPCFNMVINLVSYSS
jgi:hypothetical protein